MQRRKKEVRKPKPAEQETCNKNCTTLIQGIARDGTERAMKNHRKTMHELTTDISKKSTEGDISCRPPYKPRHADITFRQQKARVRHPKLGKRRPTITMVKRSTTLHAIRAYRTHASSKDKGVRVVNKLIGRRAEGGRSADVGIKLSVLSPQRKGARGRKWSRHSRNIGIRACASDRNVHNR
jgi:hypothetical protein